MTESIRVNFGRAIPLFPLPETVLLPHALLPLHIFEPRYRQMIGEALDGSGQIAMATFDAMHMDDDAPEGESRVGIRPVACLGQILQHETLEDGRYNILVRGICRARIVNIHEPDEERMYRSAELTPIEQLGEEPDPMPEIRETIQRLLRGPQMDRLRGIDSVREWVDREEDEVPTIALIELVGFALIHDTDRKYHLLSEPSANRRGAFITNELLELRALIQTASDQRPEEWPKGMSWN